MSKTTLRKKLAHWRAAAKFLANVLNDYNYDCPMYHKYGCAEQPLWCSRKETVQTHEGDLDTDCSGYAKGGMDCWLAHALDQTNPGRGVLNFPLHEPKRKYVPVKRKGRGSRWL